MSKDLNRVIQIGRITRDPELKYTPSGTAVATFSIAVNNQYGSGDNKKETVSYFDCVAWMKLADIVAQYGLKGTRVAIEGRLEQKRWDSQDGKKMSKIEIVVENLQFLSKPQDQSGNSTQQSTAPQTPASKVQNDFSGTPQNFEENPFSDDDIPF